MIVDRNKDFIKHYERRIKPDTKLSKRFDERLILLISNPSNPELKDHKLTGEKEGYRSFSITGDIRVIYRIEGNILKLYDIGTHNQVY